MTPVKEIVLAEDLKEEIAGVAGEEDRGWPMGFEEEKLEEAIERVRMKKEGKTLEQEMPNLITESPSHQDILAGT